jgi:hypothetical protein
VNEILKEERLHCNKALKRTLTQKATSIRAPCITYYKNVRTSFTAAAAAERVHMKKNKILNLKQTQVTLRNVHMNEI